jgi:signal transduction histidine kinase
MKFKNLFGILLMLIITTILVAVYVQLSPTLLKALPNNLDILAQVALTFPFALVLVLVYLFIAQLFMRDDSHPDYDPLSVVRNFSLRLIGQPNESALAEVASATIEEVFTARTSGWLLLASQGNDLSVTPVAGPNRLSAQPTVFARSNTLIQTLSQKRKPLFHADLAADGSYKHIAAAEKDWLDNLGMEVYVPIYDAGLLTAILAVGPKRSHRAFVQADLELLMILASLAAAAFKTMHVIADLQTVNTSMAALNQSLQKTNEEMAKMSSAKNDFLAIVSHELKTPVTQVLGFADLLSSMAQDNTIDAHMIADITHDIVKACIRLGEVITQMLEMAQLDVDAVSLTYRETTLEAILKQALEPFAAALRDRHLKLFVRGLRTVPPLLADGGRLAGAFNQLISNAIKFTPDGGRIDIGARLLAAEGDQPACAEIIIADTGIGIAPQQQALIFEKFYRVGSAAQHSTSTTKFMGGGPGLGLPVAKGIIERHGGRLWVESPGYDPAKFPGSRFYIHLPLQPPAFNPQTLASASDQPDSKKDVTLSPTQNPFVGM